MSNWTSSFRKSSQGQDHMSLKRLQERKKLFQPSYQSKQIMRSAHINLSHSIDYNRLDGISAQEMLEVIQKKHKHLFRQHFGPGSSSS